MPELVLVQNTKAQPVERWIVEIAFRDYTDCFPGQSLEVILVRGGFGQNELIDHLSRVAREALGQIDQLAQVLIGEFGGPTRNEGAVDMAIRVLREQKARIKRARQIFEAKEGELRQRSNRAISPDDVERCVFAANVLQNLIYDALCE